MRDQVITNAQVLYQVWSRARRDGETTVSLLTVLKVMHEYRNAILAFNAVADRMQAELPDGWSDWLNGLGRFYGELMEANAELGHHYAHHEDEFYPRLSRNRYAKGSDTFPIATWRKWIRDINRDANKLNRAIDNALKIDVDAEIKKELQRNREKNAAFLARHYA